MEVNSDSELFLDSSDVLSVCHLCLKLSKESKNSEQTSNLISELLNIKLPETVLICSTCLKFLKLWRGFKRRCESALKALERFDTSLIFSEVDEETRNPNEPRLLQTIVSLDTLWGRYYERNERELGRKCEATNPEFIAVDVSVKSEDDDLEDLDNDEEFQIDGDSDVTLDVEDFDKESKKRKKLPIRKGVAKRKRRSNEDENKERAVPTGPTSKYRSKQCEFCFKFFDSYDLRYHRNKHLGIRPFRCPNEDCHKSFTCPSTLKKHVRLVHLGIKPPRRPQEDEEAPQVHVKSELDQSPIEKRQKLTSVQPLVVCQLCNEEMPKRKLISHLKLHSESGNYKCDRCDNEFTTSSELSRHRSSNHSATPEIRFTCEFCGLSFQKHSLLSYHLKTHSSRSYTCNYENCDRYFETSAALREHKLAAHLTEFPFTCSQCETGFRTNEERDAHVRAEHGEPTLPCTICGRLLMTRQTLRMHMRIHTNDRRFVCTFEGCAKAFVRSTSLAVHLRSHTGEKPYKCLMCPESFAYKVSLKKHVLDAHGH